MTAYKKIEYDNTAVLVARAETQGTADSATSATTQVSATTANTQNRLGTVDVGSSSTPIYLDDGVAQECHSVAASSVPYSGITSNPWTVTDVTI